MQPYLSVSRAYAALALAEEKVPENEQTHYLTEERPFKYQLPSSLVLAQAEQGADGSTDTGPNAGAGTSEADEQAQIAEALANPLSYLWLMFTQNDTTWYDGDLLDQLGEDAKIQNTTLVQPVMSLQLTEKWKTILRPVIPINSFETVHAAVCVGLRADGNFSHGDGG